MPLDAFHPAVAAWFNATFTEPTPAQVAAWPAIRSGRHTLVAAPTGSGKTLTAFLSAIDALIREGVSRGGALADETVVVYVSPLKALSNDIHVNLEAPLSGIRAQLEVMDLPDVDIRTAVRTGDTPQAERALMRKCPPHILVTTPESLYVLLGSESGRAMLASTRSVIVDEIHAIAGNKRGSHLALSLERLQILCGRPLTRIGLSATQNPIEEVARFLVGAGKELSDSPARTAEQQSPSPPSGGEGRGEGAQAPQASSGAQQSVVFSDTPSSASGTFSPAGRREQSRVSDIVEATSPSPPSGGEGRGEGARAQRAAVTAPAVSDCAIIDVGYTRERDLALELPEAPLSGVMSNEVWEQVYTRLSELVRAHRTTLVFVNTRRMVERAARHLSERLGKDAVGAHHGSLSREQRLRAEQRLKRGELQVLVATASLELGIDIGDVELVCQLGSPRAIATFLQRVGRSGHAVIGTPKGRLFPLSRDDLVESAALLDCVRRGELDRLEIPRAPLDVLAQQIVAELACEEWRETDLFDMLRRAWPYRELPREDFDTVVRMLAEGYSTRRGPRASYLHRDAVHGILRARRRARLTAITSGGTIPDSADYAVVLEPQSITVGSVNEDFAVESLAGDIFQLGNTSYRILRVERDRVRVEDAQGMPPSIPFWIGEAPGRSDALSFGVSRLRQAIGERLGEESVAVAWLCGEVGIATEPARQLVEYLAQAQAALGTLPTQSTLVMERFFDESGGTQLVIHSPCGSRLNRAWGLALRKRFCRKFNFELQAAASDDAIVLSLSTSHSFPLADVARYLNAASVRHVLTQALLTAPMFTVRWRWNATTALALPRFVGGKKVPPQIQRMKSEDLLATVFPDQVACAENLVGEREVPDHPLVRQTLEDCLHEAMDIEALEALLARLESGEVEILARDLSAPSPLAAEILSARPYAFLDDAPLEERRTQAVQARRFGDAHSVDDLGALDAEAIDAVCEQARPAVRDAEETHQALMDLAYLTDTDAASMGAQGFLDFLAADARATQLQIPSPRRGEGQGEGVRAQRADPGEHEPVAFSDIPSSACGTFSPAGRREQSRVPDIVEETSPSPPSGGEGRGEGVRAARASSGAPEPVAFRDTLSSACGTFSPAGRREQSVVPDIVEQTSPSPPSGGEGRGEGVRAQRAAPGGAGLWICAERLPQWQAVHPHARLQPAIAAPADYAAHDWTAEDALVEILRARLSGLGPTPVATLAAEMALPGADVEAALIRLEAEGYVMQGHFTPGVEVTQWCERHLLARIHRYTLKRLRREIEPVEPREYMRFLIDWQHVSADSQMQGAESLAGVLAQLEGFEAPAVAWEAEILPARVSDYSIGWLDDLCRAGRIVWRRMRPGAHAGERGNGGPVRSTPITLLQRRHLGTWNALAARSAPVDIALSSRARAVADHLAANGALFFDELSADTGLLRVELEDALAELVAAGLVNADSFAGLRALLAPAGKQASRHRRRVRRANLMGIADAGRWALLRKPDAVPPLPPEENVPPDAVEHIARVLLRRYGVVCWRLLAREADWLPPWRELLRVYHRLEARGDIRGGRFIAGLSGEQFALPDAIAPLRRIRRSPHDGRFVRVAAADPLNLVGTVLAGDRIPRVPGSRVLYRDGLPVAAWVAGKPQWLTELAPDEREAARAALMGRKDSAATMRHAGVDSLTRA